MSVHTLIDGVAAAQIPADDRGLAYGDGLFETIAVRDNTPLCLEAHLDRLERGCHRLAISRSGLREALHGDIAQLLKQAPLAPLQVIKLIVTRGSAGRGYAVDRTATPRRIARLLAAPHYPANYADRGVRVRLCQTRLAQQPLLAGLKHLNRLEQVLARSELSDDQQEGLLCDAAGNLIEATASNLFVSLAGQIVTPRLDTCGVAGIARQLILQQAGTLIEERELAVAELAAAEGVALTNSLIGVWPVAWVEQRRFDSLALAQQLRRWLEIARTGVSM